MARSLLAPLAQENTSSAHRVLGAECCSSDTRSLLLTAGVLLALSRTMFLLGTLSGGFVLCAVEVRPTAFEMMVSDVDPLRGDPTANKDGLQCRDWTLLSPPQCRGRFAFSSSSFSSFKTYCKFTNSCKYRNYCKNYRALDGLQVIRDK